ncbi:MAG: ion transporter, partial [Bacteroidales bacterium]
MEKISGLQVGGLVLSLYVLAALIIDTFFDLKPRVSELLLIIDNIACVIFFSEFLWHLYRSENKITYLKKNGWLDLISSIPTVGFLRMARIAKVIRVIRVIRAFKSL